MSMQFPITPEGWYMAKVQDYSIQTQQEKVFAVVKFRILTNRETGETRTVLWRKDLADKAYQEKNLATLRKLGLQDGTPASKLAEGPVSKALDLEKYYRINVKVWTSKDGSKTLNVVNAISVKDYEDDEPMKKYFTTHGENILTKEGAKALDEKLAAVNPFEL